MLKLKKRIPASEILILGEIISNAQGGDASWGVNVGFQRDVQVAAPYRNWHLGRAGGRCPAKTRNTIVVAL